MNLGGFMSISNNCSRYFRSKSNNFVSPPSPQAAKNLIIQNYNGVELCPLMLIKEFLQNLPENKGRKVTSYEAFLKLVQWFKCFEDCDTYSEEFYEDLYHIAFDGIETVIDGTYRQNCMLLVTEPSKIKHLNLPNIKDLCKDDAFWRKMYKAVFKGDKIDKDVSWKENYQQAFVGERTRSRNCAY